MAFKIGKYEFKRMPPNGNRWVANNGRLVVRMSVVHPKMFCASYKVGGDPLTNMHRDDGISRRFRKKETAMAALVKFWDAI
jgi:hypothetical protein